MLVSYSSEWNPNETFTTEVPLNAWRKVKSFLRLNQISTWACFFQILLFQLDLRRVGTGGYTNSKTTPSDLVLRIGLGWFRCTRVKWPGQWVAKEASRSPNKCFKYGSNKFGWLNYLKLQYFTCIQGSLDQILISTNKTNKLRTFKEKHSLQQHAAKLHLS